MWLHVVRISCAGHSLSRYGYWSAISITLLETQPDSLSRAAPAHVNPHARERVLIKYAYDGKASLVPRLHRLQNDTKNGSWEPGNELSVSRSHAFRRAVYDFCACAAFGREWQSIYLKMVGEVKQFSQVLPPSPHRRSRKKGGPVCVGVNFVPP